ncbi:MAG: hypothetical protein II458_04570 [Oscillospiraceae bacterium]|nr:hypothetical protein [Oscillospiraceae bacterium]
MKKEDIIAELGEFKYSMDGFWLITGAALVLFGIREETEDIDMGCTTEAANRLEADGHLYKVMEDGNRWFKINSDIEILENWLYDSVELHDGYPVMSLRGIREMKQHLGREKDLRDIRLIDAFISRNLSGPWE